MINCVHAVDLLCFLPKELEKLAYDQMISYLKTTEAIIYSYYTGLNNITVHMCMALLKLT